MSKVSEICQTSFEPIIKKLGYELVEVEYAKKSDGMNLTFYIDNEKGITLEDCEKVHKAINELIDDINPTNDSSYLLNVSSLGLDRPLKTQRDFERNLNKEIVITLFSKLNGKKEYCGLLTNYNEDDITINVKEEELKLDRKLIAHIVPKLDF